MEDDTPVVGVVKPNLIALIASSSRRDPETRGKGIEVAVAPDIRKADDPARTHAGKPDFAAGGRPLRDALERATLPSSSADRRPGADQHAVPFVADLVHLRLAAATHGEVDLPGREIEVDHGEVAILMHARERAAAAPIGRSRKAGEDALARMVDPDLRFRPIAEAQMQHRLLVAPLARPVGGDGAHRVVPRLVVIERGDAVLALAKAPFQSAIAIPAGELRQAGIDAQSVIANAEREQRQRVEAAAELARPKKRRAMAESSSVLHGPSECS